MNVYSKSAIHGIIQNKGRRACEQQSELGQRHLRWNGQCKKVILQTNTKRVPPEPPEGLSALLCYMFEQLDIAL